MIKAFSFDFDGTLVDSNRLKKQCFYKVVRHIHNGRDLIDQALAQPGDRYSIFRFVVEQAFKGSSLNEQNNIYRDFLNRYKIATIKGILAARERRGAQDLLQYLYRRRIYCWINSATPQKNLRPIIQYKGWHNLVENIYGRPKSKVENIKFIMQSYGLRPHEICHVGDSDDDMQTAQELGLVFVGLTVENRFTHMPKLHVKDLRCLLPLLRSKWALPF